MRQIAATRRGDKSHRLHCCCDKSFSLSLSLRYVARIQTSLNLCDRSQRRNSVAATMIFTCHTRWFVAATCRGDVSQRFVASCVSAFINGLRVIILRNFKILITLCSEFSRNSKQTHWPCSLCLIAKSINISLRWLAMILSQLILHRYECFIGKYTTHTFDLVVMCSTWGKTKCSRQKLKQRKEKCLTKRGNSLDYQSNTPFTPTKHV